MPPITTTLCRVIQLKGTAFSFCTIKVNCKNACICGAVCIQCTVPQVIIAQLFWKTITDLSFVLLRFRDGADELQEQLPVLHGGGEEGSPAPTAEPE